jgi:uncharacterized protein YqhQ
MEKLRLGGMALANGVLVHGPTSWGCAVRLPDGTVKAASGRKRRFAPTVDTPIVRGPLRLAEAMAVIPDVRRGLPEAKLPFQRPAVATAMVASTLVGGKVRRSGLPVATRELVVAIASLVPAVVALRGGELAQYHGAEHVSIGTYERDGERASREHERCGGHLVGPLMLTGAAAGALAAAAPRRLRPAARVLGTLGAVGASVEIFAWMTRHPDRVVAKALAVPGHELQHRLSTAEPTTGQLEVAQAALDACLEAEAHARSSSDAGAAGA